MLEKVVFLDRDGVINRDSPVYIKTWKEFEFLSGSLKAISILNRSGFSAMDALIEKGIRPDYRTAGLLGTALWTLRLRRP